MSAETAVRDFVQVCSLLRSFQEKHRRVSSELDAISTRAKLTEDQLALAQTETARLREQCDMLLREQALQKQQASEQAASLKVCCRIVDLNADSLLVFEGFAKTAG